MSSIKEESNLNENSLKKLPLSIQLAKNAGNISKISTENRIGHSKKHNDPSYFFLSFEKSISKMI